ncbi:NAD(P)/FAD-dependent oxidoreductase [Pseudonocardia acaciae]|uniref:NAD(P)/FAD-dependent oxidoreductase n=1 Tax=Pseudonocardia acaciae TaxID=551276 RepID=UPI0006854CE5|nr:FAD-dependent oxidoreductase [Pseudonocardia acaciae]
MTDTHVDVLLIGGGVAAASAAAELRRRGFDGSMALATRELDPPYHRPPITKQLLGPDAEAYDLAVHPADWWADNDVRLHTRSAVLSLDTAAHTATLANGTVLRYGRALLATGAMVRRLPAGSLSGGIHYLRVPANAHKLRAEAKDADRAVLVGGSFLATEVAASLAALGTRVTMVMPERAPLAEAFGAGVGDHLAGLLAARDVELLCGEQVAGFTGNGRVDGVGLVSGRRLPADLVVVGIGAVPDTKLAAKAGLRIGPTGGIACDETLRTSEPDVFAAGDVCEYHSVVHGRRLRVEHEHHAAAQGATAARGLLGDPTPHREIPYFWTDLADWARLEYVGPAVDWDAERVTGSLAAGRFTVWYLRQGRLVAALTSGRPSDLATARDLIASRRTDLDAALATT